MCGPGCCPAKRTRRASEGGQCRRVGWRGQRAVERMDATRGGGGGAGAGGPWACLTVTHM